MNNKCSAISILKGFLLCNFNIYNNIKINNNKISLVNKDFKINKTYLKAIPLIFF